MASTSSGLLGWKRRLFTVVWPVTRLSTAFGGCLHWRQPPTSSPLTNRLPPRLCRQRRHGALVALQGDQQLACGISPMDSANSIAGSNTTIGQHREAPDRNGSGTELLRGGIARRCVPCHEHNAAGAVGHDHPSGRVEGHPQACCLPAATRRYPFGDRLARGAPDPHRTTSLPHCDHPAVAAVDSEPHHTVGLGGSPPAGQRPSIRGPHRSRPSPPAVAKLPGWGPGARALIPPPSRRSGIPLANGNQPLR